MNRLDLRGKLKPVTFSFFSEEKKEKATQMF